MKKILTMLFALLFAFTMQAQNIKLTLNNGQTVSGNTKSLFMYDNGSEIRVKDKKNGEHKDYKSSEIKEVKYFDEKGKEWITFVPLMQGGRIKMRSPPKVLTGNFRPSQLSFFLS